MKIIPLYKTKTADGGVVVTPIKPEGAYTQMVRIVADSGKELTMNGIKKFSIVDAESVCGWREVVSNNNF